MNAIKIETTVDEPTAQALPALRPFIGKRVELIVLDASPATTKDLAIDDLAPIKRPEGAEPVSVEDMDSAIVAGAKKRAGL